MKKIFVPAYAFLCIAVCTYAFTVHGYVKDTDGKALSSVAVSDGFTVVATAEDGSFSIDENPQASYLFVSIPSNCAVPEFQGSPFIYKKICLSNDARMNFVLRRIKTESRFKLFACADVQCRNMYHLRRFSTETARQVLSLLGEFDNAMILSGHTHHSDNVVLDCGIREYIIGASPESGMRQG